VANWRCHRFSPFCTRPLRAEARVQKLTQVRTDRGVIDVIEIRSSVRHLVKRQHDATCAEAVSDHIDGSGPEAPLPVRARTSSVRLRHRNRHSTRHWRRAQSIAVKTVSGNRREYRHRLPKAPNTVPHEYLFTFTECPRWSIAILGWSRCSPLRRRLVSEQGHQHWLPAQKLAQSKVKSLQQQQINIASVGLSC